MTEGGVGVSQKMSDDSDTTYGSGRLLHISVNLSNKHILALNFFIMNIFGVLRTQ